MRLGYRIKQLQDFAHAGVIFKQFNTHENWHRLNLEKFQQDQLELLVRHAATHSPFYRNLYEDQNIDISQEISLKKLPVVNKQQIMENFDEVVTDRRLKLLALQNHVKQLKQDQYYLGQYRVLPTSGSTGEQGIFVYDRRAWSFTQASVLRWSQYMGISPQLPRRRVASIGGDGATHISYRLARSCDLGLYKLKSLNAALPIQEMVKVLNDFQPEILLAYPSIASLLAMAQLEGELQIAPQVVSTGAEVQTLSMRKRIQAAWSITPFDHYGLVEAMLIGVDCPFHNGIHIFEDLFILEVVDEQNQPVPEEETGYKLLITNLNNYTQPLIRYEVSDMVTVTHEPCACGRPFQRITSIDGRNGDIVYLPDKQGKRVPVHWLHFDEVMGHQPNVKEFQVLYDDQKILICLVPATRAEVEDITTQVKQQLRNSLEALGIQDLNIQIQLVDALGRDPKRMGKLKMMQPLLESENKSL